MNCQIDWAAIGSMIGAIGTWGAAITETVVALKIGWSQPKAEELELKISLFEKCYKVYSYFMRVYQLHKRLMKDDIVAETARGRRVSSIEDAIEEFLFKMVARNMLMLTPQQLLIIIFVGMKTKETGLLICYCQEKFSAFLVARRILCKCKFLSSNNKYLFCEFC